MSSADGGDPDAANADAANAAGHDAAGHDAAGHDAAGHDAVPAGDQARDRDGSGRARNARPRDGLGRPLPYGAVGVERAPEGVRRSSAATVGEAQHLLDAGRPFHAHEVFEDAWKGGAGPERELWRGMAQLAVGLTHARRGNARGAAALLRRGADVIEPFADTDLAETNAADADLADAGFPGAVLDVRGTVDWARAAAEDVEAGRTPPDPQLSR